MNTSIKIRKVKSLYLVSFACFQCRKTFKHTILKDEELRICTICKKPEFNMGRKFRSPAKNKKVEWDIIEFITRQGYWGKFQSATGKKIAFPKTLDQAQEFIEKIKSQKKERNKIQRNSELKTERERKNRKKLRVAKIKREDRGKKSAV